MFSFLIDFILHIDKHLGEMMTNYGIYIYVILFLIIFCETGLVFTPFLPGDSILFACGALAAATGKMNIYLLLVLLMLAAILGNSLNFTIGKKLGLGIIKKLNGKFIKQKHLDETEQFYVKHGTKAIVLSRFMPIIRTFVPFVAGIGQMDFKKYTVYNVIGGVAWVSTFLLVGYFFGNIPVISENFSLVVYAIIFISLVPALYMYIKSKMNKKIISVDAVE